MGVTVRPADDAAVAVLLVDTRRGLVTYANAAALALSNERTRLPVEAATWTKAARLVLPAGAHPDGLNALPIVEPVAVGAAGGSVPGMRIEIVDDEGRQLPYWVTGSQLLTASGVAGTRAIAALFPVHALDGRDDLHGCGSGWSGTARGLSSSDRSKASAAPVRAVLLGTCPGGRRSVDVRRRPAVSGHARPGRTAAVAAATVSVLLGPLVRDPGEQRADLGLPVAAVAAESADRGELAGLGPPRDRLGVDAEEGGDLGRGEQGLCRVGRSGGHCHPP